MEQQLKLTIQNSDKRNSITELQTKIDPLSNQITDLKTKTNLLAKYFEEALKQFNNFIWSRNKSEKI